MSEDVKKILPRLNINKVAEMNQISAEFLKEAEDVLAYPLCRIINLSVKISKFPEECKTTKLKSLFRKDSKIDPKNYRPISVLSLVSNNIEELIHYQLQSYLTEIVLLYKYQSGFTANFSAPLCLAQLTDFVLKAMDKRMHTCLILTEL